MKNIATTQVYQHYKGPALQLHPLHKATGLGKALISLLTINPSWTSVKKTPGEANKTLSPQLSYFT